MSEKKPTGRPRKKLRPIHYIWLVPLIVSIVGGLLLFAVSFIPNSLIFDHALSSAYQIYDEGWPRDYNTPVGHTEFGRGLTPDAVSVMTAFTLNRDHPDNVLLKKVYNDPSVLGWFRRVVETVEGRETETISYSRYWMGFRVPIRLMFLVTAYYGMRILATGVVFVLLIIAAVTTAKRHSAWAAFALAMSIGMIEPWAIAGTFSYCTCIILLLLLIVLLDCAALELSDDKTLMLFCLFGALTQYFDFYTFPLLVCGLPLLLLMARYEGKGRLRYAGRLCGGWFASWVVTWLYNICAVSLFTEDNGIADAFHSVASRFGIGEYRDESTSYSIPEAFRAVWEYLKLPSPKIVLPCLAVLLIVLALLYRRRSGKTGKLAGYLAVGSLSLIWIGATAQPIIIHTPMQYRSVCVLYLALMLYVLECLGLLNGQNRLAAKLWKPSRSREQSTSC